MTAHRSWTQIRVMRDVQNERDRQDEKWGSHRDMEDGTGNQVDEWVRDIAQGECERAFSNGEGTWAHILDEEVCEALAEDDEGRLRAELIQVAAVCVAWIEALDRRVLDTTPEWTI